MTENRSFPRVNYLGAGWLHLNEAAYHCRFENISKNGTLVCLKKAPYATVTPGEKCCLKLHLEESSLKYHEIEARMIQLILNRPTRKSIRRLHD
jgi:hypothetical protein